MRFADLEFAVPVDRWSELRVTAIDLSGNTHTEVLPRVRGCTGCSGSTEVSGGLLLPLALASARRRRSHHGC